jgi:pyruvate formate lyase activating enzyme
VIREIIAKKIVDYIAMDIKTSLTEYQNLVGKFVKPNNILESIRLLITNDIDYEFRSTLIKEIHSSNTLEVMSDMIGGAKKIYLQTFRPDHTLDEEFQNYHPFEKKEMDSIVLTFKKNVQEVYIR